MYKAVEERFRKALRHHIHERYKTDVPVVTSRPPQLSMGEAASPVCFELAKQLKKAPRALAQEIANALKPIAGVARVEVAGGGYLNAYFDRAEFFRGLCGEARREAKPAAADAPKTIVEHTSVNPNKAAHIGHMRNAVLGDTFARVLRHAGHRVEVQNYIDNTGVQVADVALGFTELEKKSAAEVEALAGAPKFDYLCWDLYTRVTQFLAEDKARLDMRARTLKEIEGGRGEAAKIAEIVSTAIVRCHLHTFDRLGIDYDLLSQESEILHLKFWDAAFELLKSSGAIQLAASGKNAGCWVMEVPATDDEAGASGAKALEPGQGATSDLKVRPPKNRDKHSGQDESSASNEATGRAEETAAESAAEGLAEAKIIVRSNGTVTYVGKDIAYHLWKFGLLHRDFHYHRFHKHPDGHEAWVTNAAMDEPGAPHFGHAAEVVNVIDSRQAYPQQVVAAGLRALGHAEAADNLKHFSYNVVALTPRCALEMGYEIPPEDAKKPYVEVSGRKGQGVKADDLLDQLEASARKEVDARHANSPESERAAIANAIAIGALRYYLLRFTRSTVIAFDFEDALSFEGETGPYAQYAVVRVNGILRKSAEEHPENAATDAANVARIDRGELEAAPFLAAPGGDSLWEMALLAGSLDARIETVLGAQEPAFLARYAFELAQAFNIFYHKHHILSETDAERRAFLLRLTQLVREQLVTTLGLLGITAPEKM
ncbi:MAG TPA: arginine--tRNA ligase [Candidatus Acidoferrales bacterium]|nr:arginine--tRNA ligase [Candidatus Acidoferrales bacterium]